MNLKLTISDRLQLARLYPQKESLKNQILIKDIQEKVKITQEELEKYEIKEDKGLILWNKEKAEEKAVDFTDMEIALLREQIKSLDEKKEVTQNILDLCIKIQTEEKK